VRWNGGLRLALAYKGAVVEEREKFLSPRDSWLRACEFFDRDFTRTRKLSATPGKIDANRLELGVARKRSGGGARRSLVHRSPHCGHDRGP